MSGRDFGLLGSTIWQSRRFNQLGSDSARLAFCYLISTGHGNINGCYRLNPSYMAADRNIKPDQAEADIVDMAQVALIDYDASEQVVHIRQWFRRNKITNRKHLAGCLHAMESLPTRTPMIGLAAADILLSAWEVSQGWSDQAAQKEIRQTATRSCETLIKKHAAIPYFETVTSDLNNPLTEALSEALSIPLSEGHPLARKSHSPIDSPIHRASEQRYTDRYTDSDTETEGETETEKEVHKPARKRKGETASAPDGRAASPSNGKGAAMEAMALHVKAVANGGAEPSKILPPDRAQLEAMIAAKQITKSELAKYLKRSKA